MSSETITRNDLANILNEIIAIDGTDMTAQEISDFVDSLNITGINAVDYIVEQGTSGNWTYRKWNSGKAECWGEESYGSATFTANGNIYYRGFSGIALPSGLFNSAPIVFVNPVFNNLGSAKSGSITTSSFNVAVISSVSTASTVDLSFYCYGTWK